MTGSASISRMEGAGGRRAAVLGLSVGLHAALFMAVAMLGRGVVLQETMPPAVEMMFAPAMPASEAAVPAAVDQADAAEPELADSPAASAQAPPSPELATASLSPMPEPVVVPPVTAPVPSAEVPAPARPVVVHPQVRHVVVAKVPPRAAVAEVPPSPSVPAQAMAPPPVATPPAPAAISTQWQGALAAWIRARKQYPENARRMGQEGGVLLRFTVLRDGEVRDSQVVQGSGSTVLDDAALTMIRTGRLPPFPPEMPQPAVTVTVPVRYRLQD